MINLKPKIQTADSEKLFEIKTTLENLHTQFKTLYPQDHNTPGINKYHYELEHSRFVLIERLLKIINR